MTKLQDKLIEVIEALAPEDLHAQAWSICAAKGALRVTVALELEPAESGTVPPEPVAVEPREPVTIVELESDGARRVYAIRAVSTHISALVEDHLAQLGRALRAPGIQRGQIPVAVLKARYGASTRAEMIRRIGNQAVERFAASGDEVPGSLELVSGARSGDVEFRLAVTERSATPEELRELPE